MKVYVRMIVCMYICVFYITLELYSLSYCIVLYISFFHIVKITIIITCAHNLDFSWRSESSTINDIRNLRFSSDLSFIFERIYNRTFLYHIPIAIDFSVNGLCTKYRPLSQRSATPYKIKVN